MNKLLNKKIKYHEWKIAEAEQEIDFHEKRLKELEKEKNEKNTS